MLTNLSLSAATALGLLTTTTTTANAALTPNNLVAASTSGSLSAVKYTNVGGSGSYQQVTNMLPGTFPTCSPNPSCIQQTKQISGNLAPFNEDMTLVFRGPMNIYNVAVYQPANNSAASWNRVSSWASGNQGDNLVFMNNMGGGASGEWSICGGASQSFASGDFTQAAADPNHSSGSFLPANDEVNIMTGATCTTSNCDGFFRGAANQGWSDSKMFVVEFDMPEGDGNPAIWALNSQVVRSAQFGCNCRGMGGQGGCGELDIVENLPGDNANQGVSEIYSFKGATGIGNNNFFARPTSDKATYGIIFDVQSDQILVQKWQSWDFTQGTVTRNVVDGYLSSPAMTVDFKSGNSKRREHRVPTFLGGRRRHGGF